MSDDPRLEAAELCEGARQRRREGNDASALMRYSRALEVIEALGDLAWQAFVEAELCEMYQELGQVDAARTWGALAVGHAGRSGDPHAQAAALLQLGLTHEMGGNALDALACLERALPLHGDDPRALGRCRAARGRVLWMSGERAAGVAALLAAAAQLGEIGAPEREQALADLRYLRRQCDEDAFLLLVDSASPPPALRAELLA